jgi:hypothetical protein
VFRLTSYKEVDSFRGNGPREDSVLFTILHATPMGFYLNFTFSY